jgi:hypothetical protein
MLVDIGSTVSGLTVRQKGANMSWKADALKGFRLPCCTIRGFRNEVLASIAAIQRGYTARYFNFARVMHKDRESLTRSKSPIHGVELDVENALLAYQMSKKFEIDLDLMETRCRLKEAYRRIFEPGRRNGYVIGRRLTHKAITERWGRQKVRRALLNILSNRLDLDGSFE